MRILSRATARPASQLVTSWEALDPLEADWDRLWQADPRSRGLCYSYRWVREITRYHAARGRPTRPWCVVLRDPAGRVTGIAPLIDENEARRRARTLPEYVERNHALLHEGPVDDLARAVERHMRTRLLRGVRLRGLLRRSARELVAAWGASWRCSVQRISQAEGSGVAGTTWWDKRAIAIPASWEEFLRARGGNYRSSLKRATKRLGELGKLRFWRHSAGRQVCGAPLTSEQLMAAIRPIEERAWQGERHFAPGEDGRLILDVLGAQGLLEVSLLYLDERPVCYILGHAAGRAATIKYLGFDPDLSERSPGVYTWAELVRTTCEAQHLDEINLRGSEHRYKAQLADVIESAFTVELAGLTPRGVASALARRRRDPHRFSGRAALELLDAPEPLGRPGEGVVERARVARPESGRRSGDEV